MGLCGLSSEDILEMIMKNHPRCGSTFNPAPWRQRQVGLCVPGQLGSNGETTSLFWCIIILLQVSINKHRNIRKILLLKKLKCSQSIFGPYNLLIFPPLDGHFEVLSKSLDAIFILFLLVQHSLARISVI